MEEFISSHKIEIDKEKEKSLWENATFIFDTSALLNFFYIISEKIRDSILSNLKSKLWLPAQVFNEFLKNRDVKNKHTCNQYDEIVKKIEKIYKDNLNVIESIINQTKKDDKHPFLEQSSLENLKNKIVNFDKDTKEIREKIKGNINTSKENFIEEGKENSFEKKIREYFDIGKDFLYNQKLDIIKEGKLRYEFKIPPGYMDNKKQDYTAFGDLIIWKEILNYSKEKKNNIVFIIDDLKEDWWNKEENSKKVTSPRKELVEEMKDFSSVDFLMYTLSDFIELGNEILEFNMDKKDIGETLKFLNLVAEKKNYDKYFSEILEFECNQCGRIHQYNKRQLSLDFECIGSDERDMGIENEYQAEEIFNCECGNEIEVTFSVWEYPIGIHNYDEITIEGGTLIQGFQPTIDLYDNDIRCLLCERDTEDSWKSYVDYWMYEPIRNELPKRDRLKGIKEVRIGECNHCGTKHYICPNCGKLNCIETNLFHQAEGECVCSYKLQFREGEYILTKEKQIIQY